MKYRKRPIVIEAFQWTGDAEQTEDPTWAIDLIQAGDITFEAQGSADVKLLISTPEGVMRANRGDWIIHGVKGEVYPCKPDIFEATYEAVKEGE